MIQQFLKNVPLCSPDFSSKLLIPSCKIGCWHFLGLTRRCSQKVLWQTRTPIPSSYHLKMVCGLKCQLVGVVELEHGNDDQVQAQAMTTPPELQSGHSDCRMPSTERRGLISDSLKMWKCASENQGNLPILMRFPFLINFLFFLNGIIILDNFLHLLVLQITNFPLELNRCYKPLSMLLANCTHKWFRSSLSPHPLPPAWVWTEASCMPVHLGLTFSPFLLAEAHVSLFLDLRAYFGGAHLQYLPKERNTVDQFLKTLACLIQPIFILDWQFWYRFLGWKYFFTQSFQGIYSSIVF